MDWISGGSADEPGLEVLLERGDDGMGLIVIRCRADVIEARFWRRGVGLSSNSPQELYPPLGWTGSMGSLGLPRSFVFSQVWVCFVKKARGAVVLANGLWRVGTEFPVVRL
jgi:hypothetical protein